MLNSDALFIFALCQYGLGCDGFWYLCIAVLLSICIVCHTAIYIFLYLYCCFRFFGSTSIFCHCAEESSLGFLLYKVMAALADTKHQSFLLIGEDIFAAAFHNQRLRYSTKISRPIAWLTALLGATILYCT